MSNVHGRWQYRCWPVYALAASVPISIAAISLSKLVLFLTALGLMLRSVRATGASSRWTSSAGIVVLCMLGALSTSLLYTESPWTVAAIDLEKYAKLLLIMLVPYLIATREQALKALTFYAVVQIFILFSSWALAFGIPLPWVTQPVLIRSNSVFHEYLHQSIMTATFAALCWHLRAEVTTRWFRPVMITLSLLAVANVLFALKGRSAYLAILVVLASALLWETRKGWRWLALLAPVLVVTTLLVASPHFKSRINLAVTEAQAYKPGNVSPSSTGARLNFWYRSAQAIAERPLTGFGAGSWGAQYRRLDAGADPWYKGSGGNPHQEYLLWGVLLGVGGIGLLLALLVALWRDAHTLRPAHARAMKSIILVMATTALFNCVLYDGEIGDYFCLMLGLLLALGRAPRPEPGASPQPAPAMPHLNAP